MLPKNAFRSPPSEPGGGVISVNRPSFIAARPCPNAVQRIHASQNRPNTVALSDRVSAIPFLMARLR
jgi:hypothetical protein